MKGGYRLIDDHEAKFSNEESLAAVKILLESRSLTRREMFPILEKLLLNCVPKDQVATIRNLIANEQLYYIEPHHRKGILGTLWTLGEAVQQQQRIRIRYRRMKDTEPVSRTVEPVGIMFSEYYFYLIAFIADAEIRSKLKEQHKEQYPAIYRVDRIASLKTLPEHFCVPYLERFQEGEFRKRVQFMYGGELRTVKFRYSGQSIEAVLDRLPTAEILSHDESGWIVSAEVFGDGIEMWLRSQGEYVEVITEK
jgi:predicted DNA-binding transcriptional regulator YafY